MGYCEVKKTIHYGISKSLRMRERGTTKIQRNNEQKHTKSGKENGSPDSKKHTQKTGTNL